MSRFLLLRTPQASVLSESALVRAGDAERLGTLADLMDTLAEERAGLPGERAAARSEGFSAGREEGLAAGREAALAEGSARLGEALAALRGERCGADDEATALAFAIVRKVLPDLAGERMLPALVGTAIEELRDEGPHTVRAHPDEAAALGEALAETGLKVSADDALARGQVFVDTGAGSAEAGLEARLGVLREAMGG